MTERFDAIVVGAGAHGSATAWRLARAGKKVLLLEQFDLLHHKGSSHGESRIIRLTYGDARYVALAREAFGLWEELERETGEALLHRTGDLFFGPAAGPLAGYFAALDAAGVPYERLSPAEVARRFPAFRLPDDHVALHQAEGGILPATRCVHAMLLAAVAHGATVRHQEPVRGLERGGAAVEVVTDAGRYAADRVILTAGAWITRLVPELELPLRVARQRVAYFCPRGSAAEYRPDRMPVFVYLGHDLEADDFYYGVPIFGAFGVKVARHATHGPAVDPDTASREVAPGELDDVRAWMARYMPGLADGEAIEPHTCLYTVAPGEEFIVKKHPDDERIIVGSPCSGHGFKFAPAIGKKLAEM